jgi:transposase
MNITTIGIDLAKSVFQLHGTDERGKAVLSKVLRRAHMMKFFAQMPPCLIGMEACGGAHFWARKLTELGYTVKLMAPQFVKAYVKTNKNDARDAEAICEAVGRANMRFVAIKTPEQQALLALHRARQGFVRARTAQGNQIRGLMAELGCAIPKDRGQVHSQVADILEDAQHGLLGMSRELFAQLLQHLRHLDAQVQALEAQIKAWHKEDTASQRLEQIPGIGPLTASATSKTAGNSPPGWGWCRATIPETMAENLTERERACLEHLRQAEELQVSFAEYCQSFQLNVNEWYGVKQSLMRKGIVPSSRPKGSEKAEEKGAFLPVRGAERDPNRDRTVLEIGGVRDASGQRKVLSERILRMNQTRVRNWHLATKAQEVSLSVIEFTPSGGPTGDRCILYFD